MALDNYYLVGQCELLKDNNTLKDYDIPSQTTIYLISGII